MKATIKSALERSFSYEEYVAFTSARYEEGKSTNEDHSEVMLHYMKMGITRMKRISKTSKLLPRSIDELNKISKRQVWLVITEGWCGDAASSVPVIKHMADQNDLINFRVVLRDANEELMEHFLTNGGKSIPKLIILDADSLAVIGDWGPRPKDAQKMVIEYKALENKPTYDEFVVELQKWYLKDAGKQLQSEILEIIKPKP